MAVTIDGTNGVTTPGVVNTAAETIATTLAVTGVTTLQGLTVGRGAGAIATNTAVGASALQANTTGQRSVALGYQAGYSQTTADGNSFVGHSAGYGVTGDANTAMGRNALLASGAGANNSAFGFSSLVSNTSGSNNVAVGQNALQANTTASNNTAVGYQAGYTNSTSVGNTFVGYSAGYTHNLSGDGLNTFIGYASGYSMTTGAKNTIIGRYSGNQGGLDIRTASNYIVLSDGEGNPRIYHSGTGTYGDFRVPSVYGNTTGSAANCFVFADGSIYRSTSSLKYKRDVQDATHGLAEVLQLRPVTYKGKGENDGEAVFGGLIAEEVHDAGLTEFVQYAADGSPDALAYGNMVSLMVKAIQEQQALITALTTRITALEAA